MKLPFLFRALLGFFACCTLGAAGLPATQNADAYAFSTSSTRITTQAESREEGREPSAKAQKKKQLQQAKKDRRARLQGDNKVFGIVSPILSGIGAAIFLVGGFWLFIFALIALGGGNSGNFFGFLVPLVLALLLCIAGIILGAIGLVKASKDPDRFGGKGGALAGLILGAVIGFILMIILLFVIMALV